jgi:hypothetical protein
MHHALGSICRWMIVVAAFAGWPLPTPRAFAQSPAPQIEVELTSGRVFRATVDPRTEGPTLWLRFSRSAAGELTILRPVAWDRIARVRHDGKDYAAADFQPLAEQLKQITPRQVFPNRITAEPVAAMTAAVDTSAGHPRLWQPPALSIVPLVVTHFHVDAYVANWDGDVEADGIELHVFPTTAEGIVTATAATIEARLIGRRANPAEPSDPFPQIARWTERIVPEQFGPGGAILRLPFQAVHPDFNFRVGPQGVLHVRLIAPGHGAFETSADLRIRPYSGMRDRLQQQTNRRFFNGERTGREH